MTDAWCGSYNPRLDLHSGPFTWLASQHWLLAETFGHLHVNLSTSCLSVLMVWYLSSPEWVISPVRPRLQCLFWAFDLSLKLISFHCRYNLLVTKEPLWLQVGREYIRAQKSGNVHHWQNFWPLSILRGRNWIVWRLWIAPHEIIVEFGKNHMLTTSKIIFLEAAWIGIPREFRLTLCVKDSSDLS